MGITRRGRLERLALCCALGALGAWVAALSANTAHADDKRYEAGVFAGGDIYGSNIELGNSFFDDQVPGTTALFGLRLGVNIKAGFAVELEGKLAPGSTSGEDGRPDVSTLVYGLRAHGSYTMWSDKALRPFAVVGLGMNTAVFDSPDPGLAISDPDTDTAVYWGIGAKYALDGGKYGARLDVRQMITAGRDPSITLAHEVHLGVFFTFGETGTRVIVERIVEKPTPVDPPTGATDSDGDGFPDDVDKCPNEAEIVNQIDDDDGCPEIDSDNDGLLGSRDACPDAAEDADGFEDEDGCPDLDNDSDGRPDRMDACPMDPETLNGYKDNDGCPDEVPTAVQAFTGVIKGIRFKKGSARILSQSHSTLNKAVALFKEYPDLNVEVSGHTDSTGGREQNMTLSRKRADAVKWYLVDKGIDKDRVITVGVGPDKPIDDNSTRKGRSYNRRIEFRLVPGPTSVLMDDEGQPLPPDQSDTPTEQTPAPKKPAPKPRAPSKAPLEK